VRYDKLHADLIGLFERWLTLRDRDWREEEIRVFGSLLHQCLFSDEIWFWIQAQIDTRAAGTRIRLELIFPADPPYSRLARTDAGRTGYSWPLTRVSSSLATSPSRMANPKGTSRPGSNCRCWWW
jgi:hypothetical protein